MSNKKSPGCELTIKYEIEGSIPKDPKNQEEGPNFPAAMMQDSINRRLEAAAF